MLISIFFFLFLLFLAVIAIGGSLLRGVLNILFGNRTSRRQYTAQGGHSKADEHRRYSGANNTTHSSASKKREKIFDASDGEYVDYEEIND